MAVSGYIYIRLVLGFFGMEEVNQRIASGQRVVEIRPGGAIMPEMALVLTAFDLVIRTADLPAG